MIALLYLWLLYFILSVHQFYKMKHIIFFYMAIHRRVDVKMKNNQTDTEVQNKKLLHQKTTLLNKKRLGILAKYIKWYGLSFIVVFVATIIVTYFLSLQLEGLRNQLQSNIITLDDFVHGLIQYSIVIVIVMAGLDALLIGSALLIYKNAKNTISHSDTLRLSMIIITLGHLVSILWNITAALYLSTLPSQILKQNIQNAINTGTSITADMIYPANLLTINSFIGFVGLLGYILFCLAFQRLSQDRSEFRPIKSSLLLILLGGALFTLPELSIIAELILGIGFTMLANHIKQISITQNLIK